ncbi:MAG: PAS domain S-box protein [Bacteroidetes bacterium]|nr:PAS domain S-box protein [Bacteroidota bacterium]
MSKLKILHLEDQPTDAEQIERVLQEAQIEFVLKLVSTRKQYTEALASFQPEVIISDHSLPSFNSMEALKILQATKMKIPFMLVTGTVSEEFAVEAMRAGADDYILKDRMNRLPIALQNVLAKHRLDQERKKIARLLQNMDANSLDMMCSVSEEGYFLHVSAASEKILGYAPADMIGRSMYDFIYAEDKPKTIELAAELLKGNTLINFENRYRHKNGFLVTLSWSAKFDEVDRIRYGVARDVTERNQTLEKIKRAEILLRNIDANSMDVICTLDHKGQFIYVSSASATVWGYQPAELAGKKMIDFVFFQDKAASEEFIDFVSKGNSVTNFENRFVRKDGSKVPLLWSSRFEENERIIYCIAKDVTELKNAQREIAMERKRLLDLFMNAPVSMSILKGKNHVFEFANPDYLRIGGKEASDIIGKSGAEVFPELVSQGLVGLLDNIFETGVPFRVNEMAFQLDRDNNGQAKTIYQNILEQPYRDADGNVAGIFYFGVDVTEQVLARKKIEESEQRYRQIVETAQEGIWVVDERDETTFVNSKMCELLEYSKEEMLGKAPYFFMHDESKQIAESFSTRQSGKGNRYQLQYISKSGKEIWANVSANPLFHEDGMYKGALAMVTDITEKKKIEEENKKLSDVASLTVNAVVVTDREGRITWVNKGFERITEYTFSEVVGKKPGQFLQGANTDKTVSNLMGDHARKGLGFHAEILNYSKSGRPYWLDIEAKPLHDSNHHLTGFMAIEQDITERKKFEASLIRRDSEITLAAEIARLGYWEYDLIHDLFTFNDQFYNIFKTTAEAVGGYTMSSARYAELFVHPDDIELVSRSIREASEAVTTDFNFIAEHRVIFSDGEIGFISVHLRIVKDDKGRTIKNFGVNQDITERKKVELEKAALIEMLQVKNSNLQQFSYIVSHNLRAHVAKIMGLASIIGNDPNENNELVHLITEEAANLDGVVKDINTIVSAGKSTDQKKELVSFQKTLDQVKQVLEYSITEAHALITHDFNEAHEILTIKGFLYSILFNLVSNAIKYRDPARPLRIAVRTTRKDRFICLSVQDNGKGIDMEKYGAKVFGLYRRFHGNAIPGKGVGLNLVKTHAESLGGYAEVESTLNEGTIFKIYLP